MAASVRHELHRGQPVVSIDRPGVDLHRLHPPIGHDRHGAEHEPGAYAQVVAAFAPSHRGHEGRHAQPPPDRHAQPHDCGCQGDPPRPEGQSGADDHGEQPPRQHDREPLDPDVPCRDGTPCATGWVEELVVHGNDCMSTHCVLSSTGNAEMGSQRIISWDGHFTGVWDHDASVIHVTTMELLVVCPGRLVRRTVRSPNPHD